MYPVLLRPPAAALIFLSQFVRLRDLEPRGQLFDLVFAPYLSVAAYDGFSPSHALSVNYFSQLATMSILMVSKRACFLLSLLIALTTSPQLGLVVNVWTDDEERNYTRTMYRSHRQMFNM